MYIHNPSLSTHIEDVLFRPAEAVIIRRVNKSGGVCGGARRLEGGRRKTAMVVVEENSHNEKWDQSGRVGKWVSEDKKTKRKERTARTARTNLSAEILSSLKKGVLLANAG